MCPPRAITELQGAKITDLILIEKKLQLALAKDTYKNGGTNGT